jgi:hypothetical protein
MLIGYSMTGTPNKIRHMMVGRNKRREIKELEFQSAECPFCSRKVILPPYELKKNNVETKDLTCAWCQSQVVLVIHDEGIWVTMRLEGINSNNKKEIVQRWHPCGSIGVSATTDIVIRKVGNKYIARCGIAIMGSVNFKEMIDCNPFDLHYHDNYAQGIGKSEIEAIDKMKLEMRRMAEGLWA